MNPVSTVRLRLTFNNDDVIVRMNDTPASKEFVASLPRTLTFKDYAGTEKISYLDKKLPTAGAPEGSDPSAGDLAYYAPWGNLALFYKDFGYSTGLIILGKLESGTDKLASMSGDFAVRIERVD